MSKDETNGVEEVVDNDVESPTTEISEDETSQEVNTEEAEETTTEDTDVEDVVEKAPKEDENKYENQISNLNTALKQERASKRETDETIADLRKQIEESNKVEEPVSEGDTYSENDINRLIDEKLSAKDKEFTHEQNVKESKQQITELEKEFDGKDGKPLYDDGLVYKWQKENNKTYLTPKEAFSSMKRDELIDYEVKKRLSEKKDVPKNVVKPSKGKETHNAKDTKPKGVLSDEDMATQIKQAIRDGQAEL